MLLLGDCLEKLKDISDNSIDLIFADLPYGQTSCKWDKTIDLNLLWKELKRVRKDRAPAFFTTSTKFGVDLIISNRKEFRYDLVWVKSAPCGFLSARKMPLRKHEMLYCFSEKAYNFHNDINKYKNLREYFKKVLKYTGKTKKKLIKTLGQRLDHTFRFTSTQWNLPTKKSYTDLIKHYNIDKMNNFRTYEDLKKEQTEQRIKYMEESKPVYDISSHKDKSKGKEQIVWNMKDTIYGDINNDDFKGRKGGSRYDPPLPTSVLENMGESHEMLYCFSEKAYNFHNDINKYKNLREYFKKVLKYTGKTKKKLIKTLGQRLDHTFRFTSTQWNLPTKKSYTDLIKHYNIDKMNNFRTYEDLKKEQTKQRIKYMEESKPVYDISSHKRKNNLTPDHGMCNGSIYGDIFMTKVKERSEAIYDPPLPTSVLRIKSTKGKHRTEKPVNLMKWILKYYSKEGSTVLDPTMGSGSMGVACQEMKRKFIGIELNKKIYDDAVKRLNECKYIT